MGDLHRRVVGEIGAVIDRVDMVAVDDLCRRLSDAKRIVVFGCGRELLQLRGFAMRLFHLGMDVSVAGDIICPPVGPRDVFLASSGPGELSTVLALMGEAKKAGARTMVLTAEGRGSAARAADHVLLIPAQTMASDQEADTASVLPMGSVYEGALFVLFEVMVLKLQALRGTSSEDMRARHANLE